MFADQFTRYFIPSNVSFCASSSLLSFSYETSATVKLALNDNDAKNSEFDMGINNTPFSNSTKEPGSSAILFIFICEGGVSESCCHANYHLSLIIYHLSFINPRRPVKEAEWMIAQEDNVLGIELNCHSGYFYQFQ